MPVLNQNVVGKAPFHPMAINWRIPDYVDGFGKLICTSGIKSPVLENGPRTPGKWTMKMAGDQDEDTLSLFFNVSGLSEDNHAQGTYLVSFTTVLGVPAPDPSDPEPLDMPTSCHRVPGTSVIAYADSVHASGSFIVNGASGAPVVRTGARALVDADRTSPSRETSSASCDAATRFIGLRRFNELLPELLQPDGSLGVAVEIRITPVDVDILVRKRKASGGISAQQRDSEQPSTPSGDGQLNDGTSNRPPNAALRPQERMILPCESIVAVRNESAGWWLGKLKGPIVDKTAVVEVRWFEQAGKRWRLTGQCDTIPVATIHTANAIEVFRPGKGMDWELRDANTLAKLSRDYKSMKFKKTRHR